MPVPAGGDDSTLYVTVDDLKVRLGIGGNDTIDNDELALACYSASRALDQYCERSFYQTTETRTFEPCDFYNLRLPEFNDLVSVTTFATDSSGDGTADITWASTDYQLLPYNPSAAPETRPYTRVKALNRLFPVLFNNLVRTDLVHITGVWGWPAVPYAIRQAAQILAAEMFKLKDAPFGVAGFGDYGVVRIRENPKLAAYAGPYRRNPLLIA